MKTFDDLYIKTTSGIIRRINYIITDFPLFTEIKTTLETKQSKSVTTIKVKEGVNIGKSNEITKYQKAINDVNRKITLHLRNGYKTSEMLGFNTNDNVMFNELDLLLSFDKTDAEGTLKPMKAVQFKSKVLDENGTMIGQPKINGFRGTLKWEHSTINEGLFTQYREQAVIRTKENLYYHLPHITNNLTIEDFIYNGELVQYDGELYIPNMALSEIKTHIPNINYKNNTITKCRKDTTKVSFWIFDLSIENVEQEDRLNIMYEMTENYPAVGINRHKNIAPIVVLQHFDVTSDNYLKLLNKSIESGYEGIIFRQVNAVYGFGSRTKIMMKLKKSKTTECKILDVIFKEKTHNFDTGKVRTFISLVLENDKNYETFESTPEGDEEYRVDLLENKDKYIGKYATVKFYERSGVKKVPFHSNVIVIGRETIGDLDINDINIEE